MRKYWIEIFPHSNVNISFTKLLFPKYGGFIGPISNAMRLFQMSNQNLNNIFISSGVLPVNAVFMNFWDQCNQYNRYRSATAKLYQYKNTFFS